jgi:hypothetical protein
MRRTVAVESFSISETSLTVYVVIIGLIFDDSAVGVGKGLASSVVLVTTKTIRSELTVFCQ